jgi:hypothetical protein
MLDNVKTELEKFRKHVMTEAKKRLSRNKHNASKNLYNSFNVKVKAHKNSFSIEYIRPDYADYQDQGVRGAKSSAKAPKSPFKYKTKQPPSSVFEKWIKTKGIKGRNAKGQFITTKSLSYLIARSIYRDGMKPTLFFTRPFELAYKRLGDDIIEAFGLDIDDFLKFTLKKFDE